MFYFTARKISTKDIFSFSETLPRPGSFLSSGAEVGGGGGGGRGEFGGFDLEGMELSNQETALCRKDM